MSPRPARRPTLPALAAAAAAALALASAGCAGFRADRTATLADIVAPPPPPPPEPSPAAEAAAAAAVGRLRADVVLGTALVGGTAARDLAGPPPAPAVGSVAVAAGSPESGGGSLERARAGLEATSQRSLAAARLLDLWGRGGAPAPANDPDSVRQAQRLLAALGYYKGPVTGASGPLLRAAVGRFQAVHGLPETGEVTPSLLLALRASL